MPEISDLVDEHAKSSQGMVWQGISRPSYNAQLSFALPGVIYSIDVEAGSEVKAGDLLMSLDTRAEDQRLALLSAEMKSTIKRRVLETQRAQAKLDMARFRNARQHNAATDMEVQHAELQYKLTTLALEEENFRIEQISLNRAELLAQREKMRLYAACDGIVEDITVERGMAIDRNIAALRLVAIDPIIVELNLPVEIANTLQEGAELDVIMDDGYATKGVVIHKANIAVLSGRTLRVRLSVPNPDSHNVGLLVKVLPPQ
ncbi:MAG: efflux RND transporter periplasmic adaptor subunit [Pseudomonadota bacterium]